MTITTRAATTSDHHRLLAIWKGAVEATHHFLTAEDVDRLESTVTGYLPVMSDLRVAVDDGVVVGFLAVDDREIQMLFVDPARHGRGIGTALIDDLGPGPLRVDVNEDNPSGRRFYTARGFVPVGRSDLDGEGQPFPLLHLRRD